MSVTSPPARIAPWNQAVRSDRPYLQDGYWTTFGGRDAALIERFGATALATAWTKPLPRASGKSPQQMVAAEDDNVRRCAAHARAQLGA
ncbi:MAG TPA: hypothetical protein VI589_09350 [Vicinamibacteria bacterium]